MSFYTIKLRQLRTKNLLFFKEPLVIAKEPSIKIKRFFDESGVNEDESS